MRHHRTLDALRRYESPNVTWIDPDGSWPIVWTRARGMHVWDDGGQRYLDLTAAFGVAAAGHANPRVVRAGQRQMATLLHAMGDVHPHPAKAELARELSRLTFERWTPRGPDHGKVIFGNSGFEAVEAALKTAILATGRRRIIAFEGGYHGLGYGALNGTHRALFRRPFRSQLGEFGTFVPFPATAEALRKVESELIRQLRPRDVGAILVEPVQGRGGIVVPAPGFLSCLRRVSAEFGTLLVLDEIYTGFGRTGRWFACEHSGVVPDLICLGKAMTGGFPLSACVGRSSVIDAAWPRSNGEAMHTSTFLGHPVGCAMALAQIRELRDERLISRSRIQGAAFLRELKEKMLVGDEFRWNVRGLGLMLGLELQTPAGAPATAAVLTLVKKLLQRGFIVLPEGERANVLSFTPPLVIQPQQIKQVVAAVAEELQSLRP